MPSESLSLLSGILILGCLVAYLGVASGHDIVGAIVVTFVLISAVAIYIANEKVLK